MEHGVTGIMTLYFWKSVKNWEIYCDVPIESWTRHFSILSDVEIFTFDPPPLKSHQSIWFLIQAYYLIISIPNSKNWKYNNDWRPSFFCGWSKVPHRQNSIFRIGGKKAERHISKVENVFFSSFQPIIFSFSDNDLTAVWRCFFQIHTKSGKTWI